MNNLPATMPFSPNPIQQNVEIDDMLLHIAAIDDQIAHYKALKKHRAQKLDDEIDRLGVMKEEYRGAIKTFMAANGEKTLNYPGVGKVTRKSSKGKWIVNDETALIEALEKTCVPSTLLGVIVTEKFLVKTETDKLLDTLSKAEIDALGDLLGYEEPKDVLAVMFDKEEGSLLAKVKDLREITNQTTAPAEATDRNYDGLEI